MSINLPALSLLFGIISTTVLHIAKAMERQGIEIFDQLKARLTRQNLPEEAKGLKKPAIYLVGFVLNNLTMLWIMLSNMFGPAYLFTNMFGLGLVALMIYSAKLLKEPIQRIEYGGAALIIGGSMVIAIETIFARDPALNYSTMDVTLTWVVIAVFMGIFGALLVFSIKTHKGVGVLFGLFAGGCGGLDPILKGIGQQLGGFSGFLPSTPEGWIAFLPSFVVSSLAFWVTQWGFARKAQASVLVPCYNSCYIVLPIILNVIAWPGFGLFWSTYAGLGLVIVGIVLMQAFKKPITPLENLNVKKSEENRVPSTN